MADEDEVMETRRFEFIGGTSAKFWEVRVEGSVVYASWGRIGKTPRQKSWDEGSHDFAVDSANNKILSKKRKGYVEVASSDDSYEPPPMGQEVNTSFLGSASSDPVEAKMGQVYFNTKTNSLRMFVGTEWAEVSAADPSSSNKTSTPNKTIAVTVNKGGTKRAFDFSGDAMGGFDDD